MIFIDAGAFVARYRPSDTWHLTAVKAWSELGHSRRVPISTSILVLAEAMKLIDRFAGYERARRFGREALISDLVILRTTLHDEQAALILMEKYADQRIGFTDCTLFILMKRQKIKTAFSFDRHFQLAGFTTWPEKN